MDFKGEEYLANLELTVLYALSKKTEEEVRKLAVGNKNVENILINTWNQAKRSSWARWEKKCNAN